MKFTSIKTQLKRSNLKEVERCYRGWNSSSFWCSSASFSLRKRAKQPNSVNNSRILKTHHFPNHAIFWNITILSFQIKLPWQISFSILLIKLSKVWYKDDTVSRVFVCAESLQTRARLGKSRHARFELIGHNASINSEIQRHPPLPTYLKLWRLFVLIPAPQDKFVLKCPTQTLDLMVHSFLFIVHVLKSRPCICLLLSHSLANFNCPFNASILKDKTIVFLWKGQH